MQTYTIADAALIIFLILSIIAIILLILSRIYNYRRLRADIDDYQEVV